VETRVKFLAISFAIVLLPWLLWRIRGVRQVAPLAVVQILAGLALGPSCLGRLAPGLEAELFSRPVMGMLDGAASLGVLLYVFVTGLHLDPAVLRQDGRLLAPVALGSVAVPLALGAGAGWWTLQAVPDALGPRGDSAAFITAVAICVAVTALPVLAAILQEMGRLGTRMGQVALALAALNDAALWAGLAVLLAFAGNAWSAGLLSLGAAGAMFAILLFVVRPALGRVARAGDQTLLVVCLALAVAAAAMSEALGTGDLIGAFVAGAIVPPACRERLLARVEMVTATVFLPFFFMSTGLKALIDPGSASFLLVLALATAASVIGKVAGTALPARRLGFSWAESLALGAMMQTKGLMEVVVLAVLHDAGLMGGQVFSSMVGMAVICTVATAPSVRLIERLAARPAPAGAASQAD